MIYDYYLINVLTKCNNKKDYYLESLTESIKKYCLTWLTMVKPLYVLKYTSI